METCAGTKLSYRCSQEAAFVALPPHAQKCSWVYRRIHGRTTCIAWSWIGLEQTWLRTRSAKRVRYRQCSIACLGIIEGEIENVHMNFTWIQNTPIFRFQKCDVWPHINMLYSLVWFQKDSAEILQNKSLKSVGARDWSIFTSTRHK